MFFRFFDRKSTQKDKSTSKTLVAEPNTNIFSRLPLELFLKIVSELSPEDIWQLMLVNRDMASNLTDNSLWKTIYSRHFKATESEDFRKIFIANYTALFGAYSLSEKRFLSAALRADTAELEIYYGSNKKTNVVNLALILATYAGHITTVKFLLENCKADVTAIYKGKWEVINGLMPLHCAALRGNIELVKILLANGAEIDAVSQSYWPMQIIHIAACHGHKELIEYLLTEANPPADINTAVTYSCSSTAWTPLHYAAHNNYLNIVKFLVEKGGADLTSFVWYNDDSMSAFLLAAEAGHVPIVDFFLTKNVNVNSGTLNKRTALYFAVIKKNLPLIKLLVEKGAYLNYVDRNGHSPLHLSIQKDDLGAIEFFVKQPTINLFVSRSVWDANPFDLAVKLEKVAVVQMLLERVAEPRSDYVSIFKSKEMQEINNLLKCETLFRTAEMFFRQPDYSLKTLEDLFADCLRVHPGHFYRYALRIQNQQEFRPYTNEQRKVFLELESTKEILERHKELDNFEEITEQPSEMCSKLM